MSTQQIEYSFSILVFFFCAQSLNRLMFNRLVVVNPMICKYMLNPTLIAATKMWTVDQYMFQQADHNILWLVSSQAYVRSMCGHPTKYGPSLMLLNKACNAHFVSQLG